jgi:hypothetical protein
MDVLNANDQIMNSSIEGLKKDNKEIRKEIAAKADKLDLDDLVADMDKKVDKEEGKVLSTNDYIDEDYEAVKALIENGGVDSFVTNETFITKRDEDKCENPLRIVKRSELNDPSSQIALDDPRIKMAVEMGMFFKGDIIDVRKGRVTEVPFRAEQDEFLNALEDKDFFNNGIVDGKQLAEALDDIYNKLALKADKVDLNALAKKDDVVTEERVRESLDEQHAHGAEKLVLISPNGTVHNVVVRDDGALYTVPLSPTSFTSRIK